MPRPWVSVVVAAALAALLVGLAVCNRINSARAEASAQSVAHTYAVTTELSEMLVTLVDAKFTPAGGAVHIRADVDDGFVRVAIRDTGPGIPAVRLPHIFEPFRQGDEQSRSGLGLDLAIARTLVELHAGTIEAASNGADGGATFVISLPVAAANVDTFV